MNKLEEILLSEDCVDQIRKNEKYIFSIMPELEKCKGFEQNNPWHIYDVYEHILKVMENTPCDIRIRTAALFHDVGKPEVYTVDEKRNWTLL